MDRSLKAFLAVAEAGNLTAASEALGLAQPSLSKRLANLEASLGSRLFVRHRRGMELTPAGELFLQRVKRIEHELFQAREEIEGLREAGVDVLRVGAGPLFSLQYIAPAFAALRREFPGIRLDVFADTNNHTLPLLENGTLDIVLGVLEPSKVDDSIVIRELTTVEHGVVVSANDPLGRLRTVRAEDMVDRQWLFYSDDPVSEQWLTGYFVRCGYPPPQVAVRTSSFSNGLELVRHAGFVMMAPVRLGVSILDPSLITKPTDPPITNLPAGAYIRKSSLGFEAITRFVDCVAEDIGQGSR